MITSVDDAKIRIAKRIAHEFDNCNDITFVNVGVGIPSLVVNYISNPNVVIHSENGMLGVGPHAEGSDIDFNLINASRQHVTLTEGCVSWTVPLHLRRFEADILTLCNRCP